MYNKNKLQKTNEKKVMRKHKKQWVVVSLATFALLGGEAVNLAQNSTAVLADTPQTGTETASDGSEDGIKAAQTPGSSAATEQGSDDYKKAYANAYKGYTDGENFRQKPSEMSANENYNNAYQRGYDASDVEVVKGARDGIAAAKDKSSNASTTNQGNGDYQDGYKKAFQGYRDGNDKSKSASDGLKSDNIYSNSFDMGRADTQPASTTEQGAKDTQSSESNPTSEGAKAGLADAQAYKTANPTNDNQAYKDAYNQAYQGFVDGTNSDNSNLKRNGGGYDSASSKLDSLSGSLKQPTGTTESYNQGFEAGKTLYQNEKIRLVNKPELFALAFADGNASTVKLVSDLSFWDYTRDYNNVATPTYNQGNTYDYTNNNQDLVIDGNGHNVDFANHTFSRRGTINTTVQNINMWGNNYYGPIKNENGGALFFRDITYTGPQLVNATSASTTFGGNVTVNGGQNYKNPVPGAPGSSSAPSDVIVDPGGGVIDVNKGGSVATGSNQENLEVKDLTFEDGSTYTGSTYNATVIQTSGQVTIGKRATVNLTPRGYTNSSSAGANGIAAGINIASGGSLKLNSGANLNITPEVSTYTNNKNATPTLANALYITSGNITVDNAAINITMDGTMSSLGAVEMASGNITVQNQGKFIVYAKNLGNSTGNLVDLGSNQLNINNQSVLGVKTEDGSGKINLINGQKLNIDSPGSTDFTLGDQTVHGGILLDRGKNSGSATKLINGSGTMNATNVGVVRDNKKTAYSTVGIDLGTGNVTAVGLNADAAKQWTKVNLSSDKNMYLTSVPDFTFSNLQVQVNDEGKYQLAGNANAIGLDDQYNLSDTPIYVRLSTDSGNTIQSQDENDKDASGNRNVYKLKLDNQSSGYSAQGNDKASVPFTIDLPDSTNPTTVNLTVYGHLLTTSRQASVQGQSNDDTLKMKAKADAISDYNAGESSNPRSQNEPYLSTYNDTFNNMNPTTVAQRDFNNGKKNDTLYNKNDGNNNYKDAYDGFAQAKDDYPKYQTSSAMTDAQKSQTYINSYNAMENAQKGRQAYLENPSQEPAQDELKDGYNTAKSVVEPNSGAQAGTTPAATYTKNVIQGMQDYLDNQSQSTVDNDAAKYGFAEAKAGYESATPDSSKSDVYNYAAKNAQDKNTGVQKYYENPKLSDDEIKNLPEVQREGYTGTKNGNADGTQAALKGDAKDPNLSQQPKVYQDAYNTAYDKSKATRQGVQDALNPSVNNAQNTENPDYMFGYDGATDGMNADLNTPVSDTHKGDAQYVAAYNRAQGMKDALANPDQATTSNNNADYQDAYKSAHQGIVDGLAKVDKQRNNDQPYNLGYDDVDKGAKAYVSGTPTPSTASAAYNKGYTEAKSGYDDAQTPGAQAKADTSKTQQYQDSYNAARPVAQAITDYLNDGTKTKANDFVSDSSQNDAYQQAYNGAQTAANDYNNGSVKSKSELDQQLKPYQNAYNTIAVSQQAMADAKTDGQDHSNDGNRNYTDAQKAIYKEAQKAAKDALSATKDNPNKSEETPTAVYNYAYDSILGAKDYVDGQPENNDGSSVYKQAYEQAAQGHAAYKNNPNQSTDGKSQAYKDGFNGSKSAKEGSDDYQKQAKNNDKYGQDSAYTSGYNGAQDGTQDGLDNKTADVSSKPKVYQEAYTTANNKAKDARNGMQAALANPNQTPSGSTEYVSGFNGAKDGMNAKPGTPVSDEHKSDAQYVAAYNYAQGMQAALANPDQNQAGSADVNYQNGYNKAHQGIIDGLNKADKQDNTDQTYNRGYDDVDNGAKAYLAGTPTPSTASAAYNKGYNEAKAGHDDAQQPNAKAQADASKSKQYQESYNATRAALQGSSDAVNDGKPTKANDYAGNDAQKSAYQQAYDGAKAGKDAGLSGKQKNIPAGSSVAYQDSYNKAYSAGYASYQNGLTNDDVAVTQANAIQAAENGTPIANYNGPYASLYKQTYESYQSGAAQAAEDIANGVKIDLATKPQAYVNGYNAVSKNAVKSTVDYVPSAGVLVWNIADGKPVPTNDYKSGRTSIAVTNQTKVVDGISYTKLATPGDSWIQSQYVADPSATPKKVNYTEGYGVRIWNSDGTEMSATDMTSAALSNVKTYDQKVVDGISYTRINAKDSNQWVQTQYLEDAQPASTGVATLGNVPANYAIYLRDSNGNMTNQALTPNTEWKVFEQKSINGQLFYRLGNDNQWVEAKYVTNLA